MTPNEFNEKYKAHLEIGHYGMSIEDPEVIAYLDKEFEKEIQINPEFTYAQIKLKFSTPIIYTNSSKKREWEDKIEEILRTGHL